MKDKRDIPYYQMLRSDDCFRASCANLIRIPPKFLPHPISEYEEYEKAGGRLHWLTFFNKFYKYCGFKVYIPNNYSGFSIGICAAHSTKCHAIIAYNGYPYWNPDPQIDRAIYQKHQIHFYVKVRKLKNFNKIWNKK